MFHSPGKFKLIHKDILELTLRRQLNKFRFLRHSAGITVFSLVDAGQLGALAGSIADRNDPVPEFIGN